jgi:hypothetical protein
MSWLTRLQSRAYLSRCKFASKSSSAKPSSIWRLRVRGHRIMSNPKSWCCVPRRTDLPRRNSHPQATNLVSEKMLAGTEHGTGSPKIYLTTVCSTGEFASDAPRLRKGAHELYAVAGISHRRGPTSAVLFPKNVVIILLLAFRVLPKLLSAKTFGFRPAKGTAVDRANKR